MIGSLFALNPRGGGRGGRGGGGRRGGGFVRVPPSAGGGRLSQRGLAAARAHSRGAPRTVTVRGGGGGRGGGRGHRRRHHHHGGGWYPYYYGWPYWYGSYPVVYDYGYATQALQGADTGGVPSTCCYNAATGKLFCPGDDRFDGAPAAAVATRRSDGREMALVSSPAFASGDQWLWLCPSSGAKTARVAPDARSRNPGFRPVSTVRNPSTGAPMRVALGRRDNPSCIEPTVFPTSNPWPGSRLMAPSYTSLL